MPSIQSRNSLHEERFIITAGQAWINDGTELDEIRGKGWSDVNGNMKYDVSDFVICLEF